MSIPKQTAERFPFLWAIINSVVTDLIHIEFDPFDGLFKLD